MSNTRFPFYLPTKGRFKTRLTSDALSEMGIDHNLVIEDQEYEDYRAVTKDNPHVNLLILDKSYKTKYETLDDLGPDVSTGSGPARNFIWDHALAAGYKWHWIMDDNINHFWRLNNNKKYRVKSPAFWTVMEDFVLRYENVAMAGPNYFMFVPRKQKTVPFVINTRIYSCNFIRNDVPFRWRGRYNEDTILSLDMLKAGWCTIQFNAFQQKKITTMKISGGNTTELYSKFGTLPKSKMLVKTHPDVSELVWKFNRWHHHVDYSSFVKTNILKKRADLELGGVINEYGMALNPTGRK